MWAYCGMGLLAWFEYKYGYFEYNSISKWNCFKSKAFILYIVLYFFSMVPNLDQFVRLVIIINTE